MSTITAILEAGADGCLHLPVTEEMRGRRVKVTATVEELASGVQKGSPSLVPGEFGRMVLVAADDAPPMTSETIKAILNE